MARQLIVVGAGVHRPDERWIPEVDKVGPSVSVRIISDDLKHKPMHEIRISDEQALRLAGQLVQAVLNRKGAHL